jgi:hypothetical protein
MQQKHSFRAHNFRLSQNLTFEHLSVFNRLSACANTYCTCCALLLRVMGEKLLARSKSISSAVSVSRAVTTCDGWKGFREGELRASQHSNCF